MKRSLGPGSKRIERLSERLNSKIGDGVGVMTKSGTMTFGSVAGVEEKRGAFIPLIDIATILDDLDPSPITVQEQ